MLGKSSFENNVFWIIKYLKDVLLFFSQPLPSFLKQTLFYATAFSTLDQNVALKTNGRSVLQCGHCSHHRAFFVSMYQMILGRGESRDHSGPSRLTSTHWHIESFLVSLNPKTLLFFFRSAIQEPWKKPWIDRDVVCLSGAYVVVVKISADPLALQQNCGVPSKGEDRRVSQTVFKACLRHCWRDVEMVPHNVTLKQEKPQPTQSQTTGEIM